MIVLDNASVHTSTAFQAKLDECAEQGLCVYYLPPYSPELNKIERFWKRLKYQLVPPDAWERFSTLLNNLTSALGEIGEVAYLPLLYNYAE